MNAASLSSELSALGFQSIRYFDSIGSTNLEALEWAENRAPDNSLVIADEQTSGRGRAGRHWFTPADSALAFSLILRFSEPDELPAFVSRLAGLGALAVSDALLGYKLAVQIKWPNDVLIQRRKVAGILVEACWQADRLIATVLGIGVNVTPLAVPTAMDLMFPATCVEMEAGRGIGRLELLREILTHVLERRNLLNSEQFLKDWTERLAFRGEWVQIHEPGKITEGRLIGIGEDGSLRLVTQTGRFESFYAGDIRLRPAGLE